jgi:hypothetical protein
MLNSKIFQGRPLEPPLQGEGKGRMEEWKREEEWAGEEQRMGKLEGEGWKGRDKGEGRERNLDPRCFKQIDATDMH